MKILSDWIYTIAGRPARLVEYTDDERERSIPLMEFLRASKQDASENINLCESRLDK